MVKISVVVPVYNCEKYLEQCIESVLSQTLKELEVICVDDGSTDQSASVIRCLMSGDARISLLQQENKGAGPARNLAMENARGKYIAFLDADDYYLEKDALEKMYNVCETEQVAACASLQWRVDDRDCDVEPFFRGMGRDRIVFYQNCQVDYNFVNYLFRRELLKERKICFPSYRRFEDPPFLVRALYEAGKFAVADTRLYCYRAPDAVKRFSPGIMTDLLYGLMDNLIFARDHGLDILYRKTVERLEYEYMFIILKNIVPDDLQALNLLMQMNQMICGQIGDRDYVIRPIRGMLLYACQYDKEILKKIYGKNEVFLYGAGRLGKVFFHFLEKNGLSGKVTKFVVSDMKGNKDYVRGVPVAALRDLPEDDKGKRMFVVAGGEKHREIMDYLVENGWRDYEIVREEFLCQMAEEMEREGK